MKLNFLGKTDDLKLGIEALKGDLGFDLSENGVKVTVKQGDGVKVCIGGGEAVIEYKERIHFFRALGLLVEALEKGETEKEIVEKIQFDTSGTMFDVSRNAVLKVESVKRLLRYMAVMGLNTAMLYAEDTYEVEGYPYFGYMRGRYSQAEIKECDEFADLFGIELIPCIQTLAHLSQPLRWDCFADITDTPDILLIGEEKTYAFIEAMIKAAIKPLRSKKIHLGMDEAHFVGLGRYLNEHGYENRFDLLNKHLEKVMKITKKYDLEPMIWSDMYFRLGSKTGAYESKAKIPKHAIDSIPDNISLVYWDYYHDKAEDYERMIKSHEVLERKTIFAGGIWTWVGMCPKYQYTFATTNPALMSCKKLGIRDVFATMWGDNGAEVSTFTALLGLQLYAEHTYHEDPSMEHIKERFAFCSKEDPDAFLALSLLDETPYTTDMLKKNPSKYLLWQDVLTGLIDKHLEHVDLTDYFINAGNILASCAKESKEYGYLFDYYYKLSKVLTVKWDIGVRMKQFYEKKDMVCLESIVKNDLNTLYAFVVDLKQAHRNVWLTLNKPFGFETIDIRYGGVLSRIETASFRLNQFLSGQIDKIEELEEERLLFNGTDPDKLPYATVYATIAAVGIF